MSSLHRFKSFLQESQRSDILNLQPDSIISVFHGSTMQNTLEFCVQGLDATHSHPRLYPHYVGSEKIDVGLYVSPDLETALRFGPSVIKFKALGKELYEMFPEASRQRSYDDYLKRTYPKSFRPEVSDDMLSRGKGNESQARFVGRLDPQRIVAVYDANYNVGGLFNQAEVNKYQGKWIDKRSFIEFAKGVLKTDGPQELLVGPHEVNISLDEWIRRISLRYGLDGDKAWAIIKDATSGGTTATIDGMGKIPRSVELALLKQIRDRA